MEDLIYRANLVEQSFKYVRGRQHRRDPWDKQQRQAKVFERKVSLEEQRQEKTDRELEQNTEKREKDGVDDCPPENRIRYGGLVLGEPVERHVSTDKGLYRGLPKAQRQTINDRIKQHHQAENDEAQNERVGSGVVRGLSCHRPRWIRDYSF